jgi:hypothetical protein
MSIKAVCSNLKLMHVTDETGHAIGYEQTSSGRSPTSFKRVGIMSITCLVMFGSTLLAGELPQPDGSADGSTSRMLVKLIATLILFFVPFGMICGLVFRLNGLPFLEGYWRGQFFGPIALIAMVFGLPSKAQTQRPVYDSRYRRVRTRIHACNCCLKVYNIQNDAEELVFICTKCGHINSIINIDRYRSGITNNPTRKFRFRIS